MFLDNELISCKPLSMTRGCERTLDPCELVNKIFLFVLDITFLLIENFYDIF